MVVSTLNYWTLCFFAFAFMHIKNISMLVLFNSWIDLKQTWRSGLPGALNQQLQSLLKIPPLLVSFHALQPNGNRKPAKSKMHTSLLLCTVNYYAYARLYHSSSTLSGWIQIGHYSSWCQMSTLTKIKDDEHKRRRKERCVHHASCMLQSGKNVLISWKIPCTLI